MSLIIGNETRSADKRNIFELTVHYMHSDDGLDVVEQKLYSFPNTDEGLTNLEEAMEFIRLCIIEDEERGCHDDLSYWSVNNEMFNKYTTPNIMIFDDVPAQIVHYETAYIDSRGVQFSVLVEKE